MSIGGDDLSPEMFELAGKMAEDMGFRVHRGTPTTLLCDYDGSEAREPIAEPVAMNTAVLDKIRDLFGVEHIEAWPSKSGNAHRVVHLSKPLPPVDRLVLEVALGSDPLRAVLSLYRYHQGVSEPSRLFQPGPDHKLAVTIMEEDDDDLPF